MTLSISVMMNKAVKSLSKSTTPSLCTTTTQAANSTSAPVVNLRQLGMRILVTHVNIVVSVARIVFSHGLIPLYLEQVCVRIHEIETGRVELKSKDLPQCKGNS